LTERALVDCGNGVTLERAVVLRMSDGTTLVSDHYYPPGGGAQPTLLMRQPYGRDIASTVVYAHPIWFARQGYNVVIQDVRGRGDSEGTFYPFRHEAKDGFETIALLRQRPESNGKFGMYGFSYQGMTQWLAAAEQPEGLVCIAPAQTAHDLYRGWFYSGAPEGNKPGALKLASSLGWGLQMLKEDARRQELHEASALLERAWQNLPAQFLETPYGQHPAIQGTYVTDWLEHDTPSDYWSALDISRRMPQIAIPVLHLSGWYDTYLAGSVDGFLAACHEAAPEARDHQYLVAGPWQHIPWGQRIGAHDFGPAASLDTDSLHLRFFNHYLKGSGEFKNEPRIRHFALNENKWHISNSWPLNSQLDPQREDSQREDSQLEDSQLEDSQLSTLEFSPSTATLTLHLHSQSQANSSKGTGTLTPEPPAAEEPSDAYSYDPEVPVIAPGGLANAPGPLNQALLEQGNNLLVYTSAPLTEPLHVFGHPTVTLHAQTSAPQADFTAKLILLKASGEAMFISIGILRSTHAADTPHLFQIKLDPTSVVFLPGDSIRLEIASSAYPLFDRNPSTDIPPRLASPWNWHRSTQTLHHTPERSSALHLPLHQEEA
jgi:predicted acyl esterase